MNQREKNIERLQREQRELVEPARISRKSPIDKEVNKFGKLISAVSLQPMLMESQRAKKIKNLRETQERLIKKNGLNFSMFK